MAAALKIDLNCDLGESFGRYSLGEDAEIMPLITSANIACGVHAGDPSVMASTVSLASQYGVKIGAHPGFPDLQGFGRRSMGLSPQEIGHFIHYQLGALEAFTRMAGRTITHVKPHGALYNLAVDDLVIAKAIAEAVTAYDDKLILVGLAGSKLVQAGRTYGLFTAQEAFPDRSYLPEGCLMPRSQPGAVITDPEAIAENALRFVRDGIKVNGDELQINTLCLHGDHPGAVRNAQKVRRRLEDANVVICPLSQIL